ncbi:hypothetical protein F4781DRAFT_443982 [Annulohypoxylon bovei var. microspora]|nr:hypothetical protein F4781DRAFT_443982 [Annulohypoxylon bovei var. microspora]
MPFDCTTAAAAAAAMSSEFVAPVAKPSYEELENACALLQAHCQTLWDEKNTTVQIATVEISRLTEINGLQKRALEKVNRAIEGSLKDRHRLRVDKRRLERKIAKYEQSYKMMAVDVDVGAEARCEHLEAENAALEDELKGLQTEYMELVEKKEEEQKSASAQLQEEQKSFSAQLQEEQKSSSAQLREAQAHAVSQVAKAKEAMEKKMGGLKEELREKYSSAYREHRSKYEEECRQKYDQQLALAEREMSDRVLSKHLQRLPHYSSPASSTSPPSAPTTPCTPISSQTPLSSPPTSASPYTPSPLTGKLGRPKMEYNSMEEALAAAHEEHNRVRDRALLVLQNRKLEDDIEGLQDAWSQRRLQQRLERKREELKKSGGKPKRLSSHK